MEQTALFGPSLVLDVPEYQPPPPRPRPRAADVLARHPRRDRPILDGLEVVQIGSVIPLGIARQRLRGVKCARTMNYPAAYGGETA